MDDARPLAPAVIKRDGTRAPFDVSKISSAITKAFLATDPALSDKSSGLRTEVSELTDSVIAALNRRPPAHLGYRIEDIQDQVELALMRAGHHKIARAYVLYRESRAKERALRAVQTAADAQSPYAAQRTKYRQILAAVSDGLAIDIDASLEDAERNLFVGAADTDYEAALVMSLRTRVEQEPSYTFAAAGMILHGLRRQAFGAVWPEHGVVPTHLEMKGLYPEYFRRFVRCGIEYEHLTPQLERFDLERIGAALQGERDRKFDLLGLQTLADRYLIHKDGQRYELPQALLMRVAMGLSINEDDPTTRAIEFYDLLSTFDFMSSTPTLFNSGTLRPQLSSCYLTQVPDDLDGIFSAIHDNAMLSKFAGGLGNDWTPVRGIGSYIKGTNGRTNGIVPFLKVANDTAVAVNQGSKRKGAVCGYLETWHRDIEEFLELRKNTGDDRRRTHDMNTANWVPDLFMKRVIEGGQWTLLSPDEAPDLHDLVGVDFELRYAQYEKMADEGKIKNFKRLPAINLWRKMLSMLFETGHPWITFKDPCNLRSPQQHVGVVHSSNLCTEITLNTKAGEEIAVCNLGSISLPAHVTSEGGLDLKKLRKTVRTAMRMLDNVIDINYYTVDTARAANLRHRPVGLGLMGHADALLKMGLPMDCDAAVSFADYSMEAISYFAIEASADMAVERGAYETFPGSLWSQGVLPLDSIRLLAAARGEHYLQQDTSTSGAFDWDTLRQRVMVGMRNSNCMAIAPTATISNIIGVSQSIEPYYQNLYVKSNLSGDFTVVNLYLADALKAIDLWDEAMVYDLKCYDGSVQSIERIPKALRALFKCSFEVEPEWMLRAASRRQKWIDQGQSLNLYVAQPNGKKLDELYRSAWFYGLKTTYYLRSRGATGTEKTTVDDRALNQVEAGATICKIGGPGGADCEACT